jgi:hypothetical protein
MNVNMSLVIKLVGVNMVLSICGIITLAAMSKSIPDFLQVSAGSSLTGLVGLLANPSRNNKEGTEQ